MEIENEKLNTAVSNIATKQGISDATVRVSRENITEMKSISILKKSSGR